jgi:16S rRNA (uracil1498-N3)-methyltransferase
MKEVRYFYVPDARNASELPDDEAIHAVRVLRLQPGDEMMLMDGEGTFYRSRVTLVASHHCRYEIVETLLQEPSWKGRLHLAIAPTKLMDRMEWMVEKATEVGFDELTFLDCQFSERRMVKVPRIDKIVVSAMKQSRKAYLPKVNEMTSFKKFIALHQEGRRYIAHCYEEVPRVNLFDQLRQTPVSDETIVMIGPEGDFSIDEVRMAVEAGFVSVDLGKSRLRTETAGLSAVMMMQLAQQ